MEMIEILPQLHMLAFPVGHVYLWKDPDGLTVVDASRPGAGSLIAEAIHQLGHHTEDVRRLVLTHGHRDHVGSAAEIVTWGEVTVYAHHADAPIVRGEVDPRPPILADWEKPILEANRAKGTDDPAPPTRVDREVDDGDVIDFGGGAQVVAVPGHSPGSVAFYLPGPRVLFVGDAAARAPDGAVSFGVFNADPDQAAASYGRLAALDAEIACFGHCEPATEGAATQLRAALDTPRLSGDPMARPW